MAGTNNMPVVSCWLCENPTEIRFSKKDRPYLVCEKCGVQTFIRYQRAEELLAERVRLEADDG